MLELPAARGRSSLWMMVEAKVHGGPFKRCRTSRDTDGLGAGSGGHLLLMTLGRNRVDSRGRRWSLDSPNTQLNGPMMDVSTST